MIVVTTLHKDGREDTLQFFDGVSVYDMAKATHIDEQWLIVHRSSSKFEVYRRATVAFIYSEPETVMPTLDAAVMFARLTN